MTEKYYLENCKHPIVDFAAANSPNQEKNEWIGDEEERCFLCCKGLKDPKIWMHVCDGGGGICHHEDSEVITMEHGDGDCGSHPIGSDCAKKLAKVIKKENVEPKGYIHFADLEDNLLVSKEKKWTTLK